MSLTPPEIRHPELARAWLRGYRREDVDRLLAEIAHSLELAYRERADLAERIQELEGDAVKHRELEALLRSTLVSAERAAQDMKDQARRESDLIVQEAHAEARQVTRQSASDRRRIEEQTRRIRAMLRLALDAFEGWPDELEAGVAEPEREPKKIEEISDSGIHEIAG